MEVVGSARKSTPSSPSAPSSSSYIVNSYRGHKGGVTCVRFRPLMKHLVSGGADGSVLMWSLFCCPSLSRYHTQIRPYRFLGHQAEVCAVAVSPLDTVVASASRDKTVRLWIPTTEGRSCVIRAHSSTVRTVAFSPDGECLISGGDDKALKIWDVETQRFLTGLTGHVNWVRWAEFDLCGRLVVSGGDDKTIRLWDVERHECVHAFNDISGMVSCTRFHPHGSCIGSSMAKDVQIWDIRSKMLIQHYAGNTGMVKSLCFHPSGNFLLSTCDDCTLKVWDLREGKILCAIEGHEGSTTCAEFSPGGGHFASGSMDGQVILWQSNLKQGACRAPSLGGQQNACLISSMGTEQAHATADDNCSSVTLCQEDGRCETASAVVQLQDDCTPNAEDAAAITADDITSSSKTELVGGGASANASIAVPSKLEDATASGHIYVSLQDLGKTLEDLLNQIGTLTDTMSVFGERLCHIENKVLQFEKHGAKYQQA